MSKLPVYHRILDMTPRETATLITQLSSALAEGAKKIGIVGEYREGRPYKSARVDFETIVHEKAEVTEDERCILYNAEGEDCYCGCEPKHLIERLSEKEDGSDAY